MRFRGPDGPKGQRRNYSHRTAKTYIRIVREFAEHFHQSPDKLGPEQVRQNQAHLFQIKKLAPTTVSQQVSALRFCALSRPLHPSCGHHQSSPGDL
jgi:integrase-like protein